MAKFENVLISGDTPYVVEEVDTAVRYVVPASQTAPIEWNKVTKRSFDNVLKKFQVTVTKTDAETGSPQGDASLAGAVYAIYKGEELIAPTRLMKTVSLRPSIISVTMIGLSVKSARPRGIFWIPQSTR